MECWNFVGFLFTASRSLVTDECDNSPAVSVNILCTTFIQDWILACDDTSTAARQNHLYLCESGTWTFFTDLMGDVGPSGATGATGGMGVSGATGATGATGGMGATGGTGASGASGAEGATGGTGASGASGTSGTTGATGEMGATGATGASGASGATGELGASGASGASGVSGATGATGAAGTNGTITSDGIPRVNTLARTSTTSSVANIDYSVGDGDVHWQRVSIIRGLTTFDAVETPSGALPAFSASLVQVTFSGFDLEEDDIVRHAFYDGPDAGTASLLSQSEKLFQEFCLERVGYEPNLICWNDTAQDYCTYPMDIRVFAPDAVTVNSFDDVADFVSANISSTLVIDSVYGCWNHLVVDDSKKRAEPLPDNIRTGIVPEYMIFTAQTYPTTHQFHVRSNKPQASFYPSSFTRLDIDWGDGDYSEALTSSVNAHTYPASGVYTIKLAGRTNIFTRRSSESNAPFKSYMRSLIQWGKTATLAIDFAFEFVGGNFDTFSAVDQPPETLQAISYLAYDGAVPLGAGHRGYLLDTSGWRLPALRYTQNVFQGLDNINTTNLCGVGGTCDFIRHNRMYFRSRIYGVPPRAIWRADQGICTNAVLYDVDIIDWQAPTSRWNLGGACTFVRDLRLDNIDVSTWTDTQGTPLCDLCTFVAGHVTFFGNFPAMTNARNLFGVMRFTSSTVDMSNLAFPVANSLRETFAGFRVLTGPTGINWAEVTKSPSLTNMYRMFFNTVRETDISDCDFTGFDVSTVTNAEQLLFEAECSSGSFNFSQTWNFASIGSLTNTFRELASPVSEMGPLIAPVASSLSSTFRGTTFTGGVGPITAASLSSIAFTFFTSTITGGVGPITAPTVTSMWSTFNSATFTTPIDTTSWYLPSITSMPSTFINADMGGSIIDTRNWGNPSLLSAVSTFQNAANVDELQLGGLITSSTTDITSMLRSQTTSLINCTGWDTSGVLDMSTFLYLASPDPAGTILGSEDWDLSSVTTMASAFRNCAYSLTSTNWNPVALMDLSFTWSDNNPTNMGSVPTPVFDVSLWTTPALTTMYRTWFNSRISSPVPAISGWDTSSVMSMREAWYIGHDEQVDVGVDTWDTHGVRDIRGIFRGFTPLGNDRLSPYGNVAAWNTSCLMMADRAFERTFAIFDTSAWDTSALQTAVGMFSISNNNPDISAWDVSSITDATDMIDECTMTQANYDNFVIAFADGSALNSQAPGAPRSNAITGMDTTTPTPAIVKQTYTTGLPQYTTLTTVPRSWTMDDGGPA